MIIVCDLDRTLIPNGSDLYEGSLSDFYKLLSKKPEYTLVYATGRNMNLFEQAEKEWGIQKPDYLLASVGTEVFKKEKGELVLDSTWETYVDSKHSNWNTDRIIKDIDVHLQNDNLILQEKEVLNKYKISYYLKDLNSKKDIVEKIENYLFAKQIDAEVIYSFDPIKEVGLIDVLPKSATKLGSLEFLITKLQEEKENVVYCGDSGNDLLPLTAGIKAVLVNNALPEVKEEAIKISKERGFEDKLYIAHKNYSDGVIEGLVYFNIL